MVPGVIEWGLIAEVIWVSLVMGVGVIALFSFVIHGSSRAVDARRSGRGSPARYGALAAVSLAGFVGVVAFGLTVILQKG
jgi:hypothetical protein